MRKLQNRFLLELLLFCAVFLSAHIGFGHSTGYAQSSSENSSKDPVAYSFRVIGSEQSSRILIDFDKPVAVKTRYLDAPNRIILELPRTVFSLAETTGDEARGLITDIRYGTVTRQSSRIVLTLSAPAQIVSLDTGPTENTDGQRLILDLGKVSQDDFGELVATQRRELGNTQALVRKGDRVRTPAVIPGITKRVVIDPGHGGIDSGAVGVTGTLEKDVTLAVALKLKAAIEATGEIEVLMTRDEDIFMTLRERVDFTRRSGASLFISIHADSLEQSLVRGATVYTLSKRASDRLSQRLADSENKTDLIAGISAPEEQDVVSDILADLTARETIRFSRYFSAVVVDALRGKTTLIKNPQRYAAFGVLKAPEVPSVLLELGYMSNRQDEKLLRSKSWQKLISNELAGAIQEFFRNKR